MYITDSKAEKIMNIMSVFLLFWDGVREKKEKIKKKERKSNLMHNFKA